MHTEYSMQHCPIPEVYNCISGTRKLDYCIITFKSAINSLITLSTKIKSFLFFSLMSYLLVQTKYDIYTNKKKWLINFFLSVCKGIVGRLQTKVANLQRCTNGKNANMLRPNRHIQVFAVCTTHPKEKKCCVSRAYAVCWVTPNFCENALTAEKKPICNLGHFCSYPWKFCIIRWICILYKPSLSSGYSGSMRLGKVKAYTLAEPNLTYLNLALKRSCT